MKQMLLAGLVAACMVLAGICDAAENVKEKKAVSGPKAVSKEKGAVGGEKAALPEEGKAAAEDKDAAAKPKTKDAGTPKAKKPKWETSGVDKARVMPAYQSYDPNTGLPNTVQSDAAFDLDQ